MAGKLDASDIGTGAGGLIMGALASGLFNRPTGVGMTKHIGETLFKHRNEITAPLFAFLTYLFS